jgi:hypothetical protein
MKTAGEHDLSDFKTIRGKLEIIEIPHEQWLVFLDSFSRQHQRWLVTIEITGAMGRVIVAEQRPLNGITIDHAGEDQRAYVQVGDTPQNRITHTIHNPVRVRFLQSKNGGHAGLEIASSDSSTTVIRFRVAMRPEMLDGIAA